MAIVEFTTYPASPAYIEDSNLANLALDIAGPNAPGALKALHGIQIEDKSTGYLIIVWDSLESHKDFRDGPFFEPFVEKFKAASLGSPDIQHISTRRDPSLALSSPVTEIAVAILKPGSTVEAVGALMDEITSLPGPIGPTWGHSVERDDTIVLFVGWESVAAHGEMKKNPDFLKGIKTLKELTDVKATHTKFEQWVRK